jgi:hypothetical protein
MANENPVEPTPKPDDDREGKGPGKKPVGAVGIIILAVYLVLLALILLHGTAQLLKVNPAQKELGRTASAVASGQPAAGAVAPGKVEEAQPKALPPAPDKEGPAEQAPEKKAEAAEAVPAEPGEAKCWTVRILFFVKIDVSQELRLVLIVILAGALGSLVHALRSLYWYVGNRKLVASWIAMYGLLPFLGASLALVFYLVIRGGFFSAAAGSEQTSPYGFAALAALVGMFSEQAIRKLKTIAEDLFAKAEKGSDHAEPQDGNAPPTPPDNAPPAAPAGPVSKTP